MMQQLNLLHNTQPTSLQAKDLAKPLMPHKRATVLFLLHERGPMTDKEISRILRWPINSVTPRRNELVRDGKVEKTDARRDGGIVWRAL